MASHNFKNVEFTLRGARFLVTFRKTKLKIDLLLVFYCLDGFQAWFLVLGGRGGSLYKSCFFLGGRRQQPNFFWWKGGGNTELASVAGPQF